MFNGYGKACAIDPSREGRTLMGMVLCTERTATQNFELRRCLAVVSFLRPRTPVAAKEVDHGRERSEPHSYTYHLQLPPVDKVPIGSESSGFRSNI